MSQDGVETLKDLREALRAPIENLDAFTNLLESAVQALQLGNSVTASTRSPETRIIRRYLPSIQLSLLTAQLPTFLPALDDTGQQLLKSLFVPSRQVEGISVRREIALSTYLILSSCLSTKSATPLPRESRQYVLDLLSDVTAYDIGDIHWSVGSISDSTEGSKESTARQLRWEDAVTSIIGLPGKIANAVGRWKSEGWTGETPVKLEPKPYFDHLCISLERLMYELSQSDLAMISPLQYVIQRLSALSLFTSRIDAQSRSPSFWPVVLPSLLRHLKPSSGSLLASYPSTFFPSILLALPTSTLVTVVSSLIHHLAQHTTDLPYDSPSDLVRRAATVFSLILGKAEAGSEAMDAVLQTLLSPDAGTGTSRHALIRIVIAWISQSAEKDILAGLDIVMDAWTDPRYIRFALYRQQYDTTYALLSLISLLDPYHPRLIQLSHRTRFLTAMQTYLSHPDASVRRLGMLVAEVVSERTLPESSNDLEFSEKDEIEGLKAGLEGDEPKAKVPRGPKRLKFGASMWEGKAEGREEARVLRSSVGVRDRHAVLSDDESLWLLGWDEIPAITQDTLSSAKPTVTSPRGRKPTREKRPTSKPQPKIVMLDDEQAADSLEGYDMPSPSSSRSPSPTPSYLEEIAADPTLALDSSQKKKVQRPVYIAQLHALLKEREKPECIEMALRHGESLIRAKRTFGGELEENAVGLATMLVALNDPFNLDDFDDKRQGMLNALVACAPRQVAPFLADIYFTGQFSLHQRAVILTAIVMGARELAGMPVPLQPTAKRIDFPSKTLPPALHRRYATQSDFQGQLEAAVDGVRGMLLSKGARQGEEEVPELARQKRLRMSTKRPLVVEHGSLAERELDSRDRQVERKQQDPVVPFKDVAAEYFILPLVNRFWAFFQDSATRETRAKIRGDLYRGAGTGMVLSPSSVEKFLMTLVLLLHASRHSALYLHVLAPETLELAMALATRHQSSPEEDEVEGVGSEGGESGVVGSALELALVVLDASFELDQGRTLATQKATLLGAVGEWAATVFKNEERGVGKLAGQGGMREGRVRSGAAGVVVKVSDIAEKWGRLSIM